MGITSHLVEIEKFISKHKHSDANAVFNAVKKKLPSITKATVYRNLEKMVKTERLTSFELNGRSLFEIKKPSHCHFVCMKCGKIFEINAPLINEPKDFKVQNISIIIRGACKECT